MPEMAERTVARYSSPARIYKHACSPLSLPKTFPPAHLVTPFVSTALAMSARHLNVSQFLENLNAIDDSLDYGSNSSLPAGPSSHGSPSGSRSSSGNSSSSAGPNASALNNSRGISSSGSSSSGAPDEELAIFANTRFFDFDMGCSTDIAATMDDLLMQQEQQLQYSKGSFNNGASSSSSSSMASASSSAVASSSSSLMFNTQHQTTSPSHIHSDLAFDLGNLQQFSLANELLPLSTASPSSSIPSAAASTSPSSGNAAGHQQQTAFSNASTAYLQHQFTDPLTLSTQPRLSHLVASPALNSMINHQQNNNNNSSQFHQLHLHQLHQPPFQSQQQAQTQSQRSKFQFPETASPQLDNAEVKLEQHSSPLTSGSTTSPSVSSQSTTPPSTTSPSTTSPANLHITATTPVPSIRSTPIRKDETIAVPPPNSKRRRAAATSGAIEKPARSKVTSAAAAKRAAAAAAAAAEAEAEAELEAAAAAIVAAEAEAEGDDASKDMTPEEDKRRRNTAASARFRVKKKLREQQMERAAKDLQDRVHSLETKIMQLEMENKWLRNIVVEKNEARDMSELFDMKKKIMSETSDAKIKIK